MRVKYNYQFLDEINVESFRSQEEYSYLLDKKLEVLEIEKAIILPYERDKDGKTAGGGVTDAESNYIELSAQRIVGAQMNHGYDCKEYEKSDKTVLWFGAYHEHWGHFLNEMVARCWYLLNYIEQDKPIYVAYIRKEDSCKQQIGGNFLEFLELLGVRRDRLIEVINPTQFECVIVPELSCIPGKYYTKEYIEIFNRVRDNVKEETAEVQKVYFTRLKSKRLRSTELGEKKIKKLFQQNQYIITAPELCSLREQISIIKNCDKMVVISGTLPHNILFARDGIDLTIINRTGEVNSYQPLINEARGANITYIDAHLSLFPVFAGGPFLLYLSENLISYARDKHLLLPKKSENMISLHLKLAWYFYCYLDNMTGEGIRHWNLDEKYGKDIMATYAFYRDRIPQYDKLKVQRLRKCFYILARMFE